eukprot:3430427-Pyramimonas_sp.AAC.1
MLGGGLGNLPLGPFLGGAAYRSTKCLRVSSMWPGRRHVDLADGTSDELLMGTRSVWGACRHGLGGALRTLPMGPS